MVSLGPKSSGRAFKTRYIKTAYNNAVEVAQLDDVTVQGVTLKELQELLGHSSLAMTMRYAHLAPPPGRPHQHRAHKVSAQELAQEPVPTVGVLQKSLQ